MLSTPNRLSPRVAPGAHPTARTERPLRGLVAAVALLLLAALLAACGTSDETNDNRTVDSESHWLLACASDADCGSDLQCWCGACTRACTAPGEDCDDGVACVPADGLEPTAACRTGETSAASGSSATNSGAVPAVPGAYLCLPACSDDGECAGRRCGEVEACLPPDVEGGRSGGGSSGALVCEDPLLPQDGECHTCHALKEMHRDRLMDEVSDNMVACERSTDCITPEPTDSLCLDNNSIAICGWRVVIHQQWMDAFWALDASIAQETCQSPEAPWQGCRDGTDAWKWDCDWSELPACVQGRCLEGDRTDVPHVRAVGGPGDTHDRIPMLWTPDGETCTGEEVGTLSLCEWLATMDGLLVGELTSIAPIHATRPDRGQPAAEDVEPWDCPDEHRLAMELLLEPIARFGQASSEEVTRVTIGPDDLRRWVPQPQLAPRRWGGGSLVWGGIPDDVPDREADTLHAGAGRLVPDSRHTDARILVLPIVAGEPDTQGNARYGLGGHLFGLHASDAEDEAPSRVVFQRATACIEPYRFGEDFRDLSPDAFLAAVEACYAQGLPEQVDDVRLPLAPLPPEAFDSRCVSTP